jgi:hypothetical protein
MYILDEYQRDCRNFILNNKSSLITLNMGLGKTLITLDTLTILKEFAYIDKILLISFPNILHSWENEINKFNINLSIEIVEGNQKERLKQLNSTNKDIIAISIYNFKWFVEVNKIKFDCLIIDESSGFKNPSTIRFKNIKQLLKKQNFKYKILLSGTPNPNSYIDLWSQIYILDMGKRLEPYITKFKNKYMQKHPYLKSVYQPINGMDKVIMDKIKDISFNIEVKDIHKINYYYKEHRLDNNITKIIKDMKTDFIMNIDDNLDEDSIIKSASVLYSKLLQISSGGLIVGDEVKILHLERIKLLKELLESYDNENFIIVYNFKFQRNLIIENIKNITLWDKKNATKLINKWNNKKIKYLLVHHGNISHGVNMQGGGSNIIYFSPLDNLENYLQLNKRLARGKDKKIVNIFHLFSTNDDKKVYKSLENKNFNMKKMLKGFIKSSVI